MITTLRTGALTLGAGAEYKFDATTKLLTIKLTCDDHKLYGDVNIELSGCDDIDIYEKDGELAADYFNDTFKFSRVDEDVLQYSEVIDRGVADTAGAFVSLGDVAIKATGEIEITDYADLVSGTDDSITVGATVFTAQAGAATLGQTTFQAATGNDETAASLAAQINAHATAGALVLATVAGAVITLTAKAYGVAGNSIALAYTDNDTNEGATVSGANLEDGADGVEADVDNASFDLPAGNHSFFLIDTADSDFSTSKISIKQLDVGNSGVDGLESVFDEDGEGDYFSINGQDLSFSWPARVSIKDNDANVTNIPLVINN